MCIFLNKLLNNMCIFLSNIPSLEKPILINRSIQIFKIIDDPDKEFQTNKIC